MFLHFWIIYTHLHIFYNSRGEFRDLVFLHKSFVFFGTELILILLISFISKFRFCSIHLGPVVQSTISANPVLNFNLLF
jgi:hypothetical protein